jgi:hypothetical protein
MRIEAIGPEKGEVTVDVDRLPDECPLCGRKCIPIPAYSLLQDEKSGSGHYLIVACQCPNSECGILFTALYRWFHSYGAIREAQLQTSRFLQATESRQFTENIQAVSSDFCEIYRQAEIAEANGLRMICGVGYRKSLEFLIKDFLVGHVLKDRPEDQKKVRESFLGDCIKVYVEDARIKAVAQRAVWLGNDETHYVRLWPDKDLGDLKRLVSMTVNWIDLTMDSEKYVDEMVPGKQGEGERGK